jgi:glycogen(starch) synthase
MRVLFWSELFWPHIGGAEVLGTRMVLALRERGHEFVVVTRHDDPGLPTEERYQGVPIYRFPFFQVLAEGKLSELVEVRRRVIELKRTFAPDLVHINAFGPSGLYHLDTAAAHPAPLLVTFHGHRYPPPDRPDTLLERILRAADWVTAPSLATMEYVRGLVPGFSTRSSVIYNGLDVPSLSPAPLPWAPPHLLFVGRIASVKGIDLALDALAQIADRYPHVRLTIAGDGTERMALEEQAAELGLAEVVDFVGWVAPSAVPELLNTATMVLMPSRTEAMPLVALQAGMMARPVVGTEVGGFPEVVVHGETGLLVRPEDSKALAETIALLLDRPDLASRMGSAARRRALDLFGWERFIDSFDALYQRLAASDQGDNKAP